MMLSDLQAKSASVNELVLPLAEANMALEILLRSGTTLLGWEGWIRYPDGRLGHSAHHQGTKDLSDMPLLEAYRFARDSMQQSHSEHECNPEVPDSELLFCITSEA